MNFIRSFIAIELPSSIKEALLQTTKLITDNQKLAVKWVSSQNLHLTIVFLGNMQISQIDVLKNSLNDIARHHTLDFSVGSLGAFPNIHKPRVLWVGIQHDSALVNLYQDIAGKIKQLGISTDNKPFSPHLTIGRVQQNASNEELKKITASILRNNTVELGSVTVEEICLFRSELKLSGSVYTRLHTVQLSQFE